MGRFRIDVEPEAVREECARRLIALYSARDRAHLERLIVEDGLAALGGDAEAVARRASALALAEVSKRLRAMSPIPHDFTAEKWWPPAAGTP